jgi:hypothetical protein
MVQRRKQGAAVRKCAQAVEADGIQPLEDVAVFPVLRGAAMLLDETLDFLEPGDDAFLAGGRPPFFSGCGELGSSAASSSRSRSLIATLFLEAHERGSAFGHARSQASCEVERGDDHAPS